MSFKATILATLLVAGHGFSGRVFGSSCRVATHRTPTKMMFDFLKGPVKAKAKAPIPPSPQENESVALFRKKWPYGVKRESNLPEAFRKTGAPEGSIQAKLNEGFSSSEPKRDFGDIEDDTLRNTFKEISRLYGGDNNALEIVKAEIAVLAYNSANFEATKQGFLTALATEKDGKPAKFTEADVIATVVRNPLLLGLRPTGYGGADKAGEDTVYISYFIAFTRPLGPVLLSTLFLLLLTPVFKSLLDIH